ncbi:MAG: glycosyltransferase family 4 protein [Pirellulales bacterium]
MLKVLVVGQTPPPYHGQAIMIDGLVRSQLAGIELVHARMGFSSNVNEVGRVRLAKVLHLLSLIARIIYHRVVNGTKVLYYPPGGADRVPMIRDLITLLATRWMFDKTVFHYHTGGLSDLYDELPSWQQWLFRKAYFGADAAIRNSALNPEDGRRLAAKRDYIIPNGIDDPCPTGATVEEPAGGDANRPLRILFVGTLCESKGALVLVEACKKLADRGVPFEVAFMGGWSDNEFAAQMQKRIEALQLADRVRFLGVLTGDAKFAAFKQADVFCFPTFFKCETFGLVLLEAMACGLPVVAARWRGIPTVVDNGKTGFLVEPQDADAVAEQLAHLAADAGLRHRLGQAGRERFLREFTFTHHLQLMRRMFLETAGVETVGVVPSQQPNPVGEALAVS